MKQLEFDLKFIKLKFVVFKISFVVKNEINKKPGNHKRR